MGARRAVDVVGARKQGRLSMINSYDRGPRAKMFIPCPENRCMVVKNGVEVKSRLQLRVMRDDGTPLDSPFYLCERDHGLSPCRYSSTPLPAKYVGDTSYVWEAHRAQFHRKRRDGEDITETDMDTML